MPIISGTIVIDEVRKTLTYTGSVTHTSQTFTFNEKQDQISIKNTGASPITLTVESRSYIILTNNTTTVSGEITFFNLMTRGLTPQSFELTSYAYLNNSNGNTVINDPQFTGNATFVEDRLDSTNKTTALSSNKGRELNDGLSGVKASIGDLTQLQTVQKGNLVDSLNELKNIIGTVGGSGPDTTAPNNVSNLVVSNLTTNSLTLTWAASISSDVASYDVYLNTTLLGNVSGTTYNVTGLSASTIYTFWVKSKDFSGNLSSGSSIAITTNAIVDSTPPVITASPSGGSYSTAQTVTLNSDESATIYYTTNGTTPTTSSSIYTGPITISSTTTLKYFGKDTAGNTSAVQTASFTITIADVTPPTLTASPVGGTFASNQTITLSSNENAAIYYTKSGNTPAINGIGLPKVDKVVIVVLENHALSQIQGSSAAPYINSLMSQGANFQNMKALTHPSQPNYYNLFAGSTMGITDSNYTPPQFNTPNLYTVLNAGNYTFAGYCQSMPSNGYTGIDDNYYPYADRHNPWKSFINVPAASNLTFTSFPSSNFSLLPTVSFVIPDDQNNMHDGSVAACDTWLQTNIDPYYQWAKNNNSLLIVVWDEDDSSGNNTIPCIFLGPMIKAGSVTTSYNHYNLLRTISDLFGVGYVGSASTVTSITDVWKTPLTTFAPANGTYLYQYPISITGTTTLKYFGKDSAGNNSTVQSQVYTINTSDVTPPNNVTNLASSNLTNTSVMLTWSASTSTDIASYDIYVGSTFIVNTTSTNYTVTGLNALTTYTLWVKAKDTSGNVASGTSIGITTTGDTTPPNNVTNLTTTNVLSTSLTLNWLASTSSDIASYDIYNGSTFITNVSATTYNVTGLTQSTAYVFWVKAKDISGNVASGTSVNVTTTSAGPVTYASDSFNRTNNTSSMGSTDSAYGGSSKTWTMYTTDGAIYGIINNSVYGVNVSGKTIKSASAIDVGVNDYSIEAKFTTLSAADYPKIVGRVQDHQNYLYMSLATPDNVVELGYYTNGSGTVLQSYTATVTNGDVLKMVVSGNQVTGYYNGTAIGSAQTIPGFLATSSKVGINLYKYPNSRIDDFKVTN